MLSWAKSHVLSSCFADKVTPVCSAAFTLTREQRQVFVIVLHELVDLQSFANIPNDTSLNEES